MEKKVQDKLFGDIDAFRDEMIDLQRGLTAVPAIAPESGGDGEERKAAYLSRRLSDMGFSRVERFHAPDPRVTSGIRPSLSIDLPGSHTDRTLLVMTHIDIVPPGDATEWRTDPFTLTVRDGKLLGRGTEDNQQSLVASLFALRALMKNGLVPHTNVRLLFVADEETGSQYGIKYLLDARPDLFRGKVSALVPDAGNTTGTMIEIAEKNILWLKLTTKGKQIHASTPHEGRNAFVAGSDLVMRLAGLNRLYAEKNDLFDPPVSTFSPTKKEANVPNVNTIPGEDVFYIDCRILPELGVDVIVARIQELGREIEKEYGVTVGIDIVQQEVSPPTAPDSPIVGALARAVHAVRGKAATPAGIGGGTVAAHLRRAGIDTVVWSTIDHTAHMPNEYCLIDNMVQDAKVMALLMLTGG
ncbi:MAG TPA: M20 family metallo-hydrolase [Spirochaetia bacterium]|nr:M20 family metallo-hydrolase [Spirochaetia bacterium]